MTRYDETLVSLRKEGYFDRFEEMGYTYTQRNNAYIRYQVAHGVTGIELRTFAWRQSNVDVLDGVQQKQLQEQQQDNSLLLLEPWISTIWNDGISHQRLTQQDYNSSSFLVKRQKALDYAIKYYWYHHLDSQPYLKKYMASEYLRLHPMNAQHMYDLMIANDVEPWQSVLAYNGLNYLPINPSSEDSRIKYFYEVEYPFQAYLVDIWWPQWGSNPLLHDRLDRDGFALRISHTLPNVNIILEKTNNSWENNKKYLVYAGVGVLAVSGLFGVAAVGNAIKK